LAKDWECLSRKALAFLRLASIRLMLRKLCIQTRCSRTDSKAYQAKDMLADPYVDDLATLGLDVMVGEAGWARHAPNPLVLVG
jgi:formate dehydrogenase maturation protein FdhE